MAKKRLGVVVLVLAALVLGLAIGTSGFVPMWGPGPISTWAPPNPAERTLNATLYQQTAAEYDACCLQAYALGSSRLKDKLAKVPKDAAKPPAVVMDLDETVFDNSPFQAYLILHGLTYTDELWALWERDHAADVRLVPGAAAFIHSAERQGVTVVYISNRLTEYVKSTEEALHLLGLGTDNLGDRLLLKEQGGSSDKTARRKQAAERYNVLLYFGDNLRDFSEEFVTPKFAEGDLEAQRTAVEFRKVKVHEEQGHWDGDWIILPNPVYGEWLKPLGNDPKAMLRPRVDLK